ncbi:phosphatase [Cryobacterium sp. Y11]|uniref:phosphatase n=1 Tax=Cryobacterium sp. Y11 TaxID=2045016 RepID=UPI000CE43187|nr:phosphatase [Cryobacterium sp. Y11]
MTLKQDDAVATQQASALLVHLVESHLAGEVQTSVANTKLKMSRLLAGNPACTFGLNDWQTATEADVADAIMLTSGASLNVDDETRGYIDPIITLVGIDRYAGLLSPYLRTGGANVLIATGHPTGLLEHYIDLGRALQVAGNRLLSAHDDGPTITAPTDSESARTVRFVGSVGCVYDGLSLVHSHLADYMEVMLNELEQDGERIDLVIADHGMAGAAIARGIPTLSIADVNDPALPLAYARGSHDGVFVIDDNLAPALFRPVTRYILQRATE